MRMVEVQVMPLIHKDAISTDVRILLYVSPGRIVNCFIIIIRRSIVIIILFIELMHADDDNLITLKPLPGHQDCNSDYINASYIDVLC